MDFIKRALLSRKDIVYEAEKEARCSYSQSGEDLVLWHWLFMYCDLEEITYLDIGSAHPISLSNTYYFYKECTGNNIVFSFINLFLFDKVLIKNTYFYLTALWL